MIFYSLVQIAIDSQEQSNTSLTHSRRERRASESEIKLDNQRPKSSTGATGGDEGAMAMNGVVGVMNVDIMQMLTKAQDEYDQVSRNTGL